MGKRKLAVLRWACASPGCGGSCPKWVGAEAKLHGKPHPRCRDCGRTFPQLSQADFVKVHDEIPVRRGPSAAVAPPGGAEQKIKHLETKLAELLKENRQARARFSAGVVDAGGGGLGSHDLPAASITSTATDEKEVVDDVDKQLRTIKAELADYTRRLEGERDEDTKVLLTSIVAAKHKAKAALEKAQDASRPLSAKAQRAEELLRKAQLKHDEQATAIATHQKVLQAMQQDLAAMEKQLDELGRSRDEAKLALDSLRRQEATQPPPPTAHFKESLASVVAKANLPADLAMQIHSFVDQALLLLSATTASADEVTEEPDQKRPKLVAQAEPGDKDETGDAAMGDVQSAWAAELSKRLKCKTRP